MIGDDEMDSLRRDHRQALHGACGVVCDQIMDDIIALRVTEAGEGERPEFGDLQMSSYLPRRLMHRYDSGFLVKFFASVVMVGWKLHSPGDHRLASTAEEIGLRAMILAAEASLEVDGVECDFDEFIDLAFQDLDHELLFDAKYDGIADDAIGRMMGMESLAFEDWFKPFLETAVHPIGTPSYEDVVLRRDPK